MHTMILFNGKISEIPTLVIFSLMLFISGIFFHIEAQKPLQIWGYYPYWLKDEWKKIDLKLYDQVLFFDIPISSDSHVLQSSGWPEKWQQLIAAAKGTRLQPTFTLFDAKQFEQIFSNQHQRDRLQAEMTAMADQTACSGLQLDFEIFGTVSKASADGFRLFIKSLKHELDRRKKLLSLFVLTEDSAQLYDKKTLMNADYIVIQGYDAHWKGSSNAGPVALLHGSTADSWDSSLKHFLSLGVARNKILMSVPYYGYEWPTVSDAPGAPTRGAGREISFAPLPFGLVPEVATSATERIKQYGFKRDPESGSPYYVYKDDTGWHQGWFEDDASLSAKFEFIKKQQLAGVAVFSLGYDGGHFQDMLRRYFRQ